VPAWLRHAGARLIGRGPVCSRRAAAIGVAAGLGGVLLAGCSVFDPRPKGVKASGLEIRAVPNANGDSPVALDVVVPYAKEMLDQLVGITAREWFRRREQFMRDFPTQFDILQLEIVPGTVRKVTLELRDSGQAEGALVFANYFAEGAHRVRIDKLENIVIDLLEHQFVVRQIEQQ
tara:strand:- start:411 stop:938 length:528 start_codon:yes stop_codon:yes gene_type:complete